MHEPAYRRLNVKTFMLIEVNSDSNSEDDDGQNQLSSRQEAQLIELKNDGGLKTVFNSKPLTSFWIKASIE